MKTVLTAVTAAIAAAIALPASAGVILTANFDDYFVGGGPSYTFVSSIDGFTSTTNFIELQANNVAGIPYSAPNLVELDTFANSSMFYTLGAGHYSVSYYYSPRPGVDASSNGITLSIGSVLLDAVTATGGSQTSFALRTVDFTTIGGDLTFAAVGTSDGVGGYLDNVTIATIPEPAAWTLMIGGFGLVGAAARRRRGAVAA